MNFLKIAALDPVDKEASLVTGPGEHYDTSLMNPQEKTFSICPEIMRFGHRFNKKRPDFRKKTFGRLTAIGLSVEYKKKWVLKCSCGRYVLRTNKALINYQENKLRPIAADNLNFYLSFMCQYCHKQISLKKKYDRREIWISLGAPKREIEAEVNSQGA